MKIFGIICLVISAFNFAVTVFNWACCDNNCYIFLVLGFLFGIAGLFWHHRGTRSEKAMKLRSRHSRFAQIQKEA